MGTEAENREAFRIQAGYCAAMAAPVTARIAGALAGAIDRVSVTGRRVLDWAGEPVADAVALRLVGGLHALHRTGVDAALSRVFAGAVSDPVAVEATLRETLRTHDAALSPWLDGPPQTNEAARSAGLMTGLLHLAARYGPRLELIEIGSSAGLNLLIDDYAFDLGGVRAGPANAAVTIRPEWRGPPPPDVPVEIVSTRGVDIAPIDLSDPAAAERLQAYVWIEATERAARLAQTIALVRARGVRLDRGDAADWVAARLAEPQAAGVTRVLMHSVVWQYLGAERQERIRAAMHAAGGRATAERPLGWVMMEPNRDLHRHEVRVRGWPGERAMELVGLTHAHGAWVEGLAEPYSTADYVMRGVAPE
ncbi:DUF2332 domain-containing protein [Sphingomonas donggukensis]|uniref:DUF2332 domain-containing protein n=1 Tax=Sphingomonas donggukensis TaxID=2949093 RepID=A0ABY4TTG8_9SPHN|nr:DUF2332 domain-containing protein [Sphingomonas donggukensis]URW74494.1 DUF2332 domain-containing protein [Sphingomonas donggukensis]